MRSSRGPPIRPAYARRWVGVHVQSAPAPKPRPHGHGFVAMTSCTRAGYRTDPEARETVTHPDSSGWRSVWRVAALNSAASSRKRTPPWARLIAPGRMTDEPPPTIAGVEALWCGATNGGTRSSPDASCSSPASERTDITSRATSSVRGGRIVTIRSASIVLPEPGGPPRSRWWPPAAASSTAARASG